MKNCLRIKFNSVVKELILKQKAEFHGSSLGGH